MEMVIHQLKLRLFENLNMNSDHTSPITDIDSFSLFAIQCMWTGFSATSASIIVEGSIDDQTFTAIDEYSIPAGATGSYLINVEKAGFSSVRVRFTQTGGAGTLNGYINGKIL